METRLQEVKKPCQKVPEKPQVKRDFGTLAQWHFCILLIVILREFKNTYGIRATSAGTYARVHQRGRKGKKKMNRQEKKTRNRVLCVISALNDARKRHTDDAEYIGFVDKCLKTANESFEELEEGWNRQ